MSTTTISSRSRPQRHDPVFLQIVLLFAGGLGLFLFFLIAILVGFSIAYGGKIYPGISVSGIRLNGLTLSEANDKLARGLLFAQTGKIVFVDNEQKWIASPAELGLNLDFQANSRRAYAYGRSGGPLKRLTERLQAWGGGVDLAPSLTYDEQVALNYLGQISAQVDRPTLEASLKLEGVEVIAVPGQVGRSLDVEASLQILQKQIQRMSDGLVPLAIVETPPEIMDASQQAETARQILSQPLTLTIPDAKEGDPGPWKIPPSQLAEMLVVERTTAEQGAQIQVSLSEAALTTYLSALAGDIDRYPVNARFIFNDDTRKLDLLQPSRIGRSLDIPSTIQAIQKSLAEGQHTVPMSLVITQPAVPDSATGEQLGVTENVITTTSYFRGSTNERLQNIKTAAANFHGLLIPPGETFSMASAMGNVSLDSGYAEAWIIFGGRTIKGVGGGVCQVSTTLFPRRFPGWFSDYRKTSSCLSGGLL